MKAEEINNTDDLIKYIRNNNDKDAARAVKRWVDYWTSNAHSEGLKVGSSAIQVKILSALGLDEIIDKIRDDIYNINNPI